MVGGQHITLPAVIRPCSIGWPVSFIEPFGNKPVPTIKEKLCPVGLDSLHVRDQIGIDLSIEQLRFVLHSMISVAQCFMSGLENKINDVNCAATHQKSCSRFATSNR